MLVRLHLAIEPAKAHSVQFEHLLDHVQHLGAVREDENLALLGYQHSEQLVQHAQLGALLQQQLHRYVDAVQLLQIHFVLLVDQLLERVLRQQTRMVADLLQHQQLHQWRFDGVVTKNQDLLHFVRVQEVLVQLDLHLVHLDPNAPVVLWWQALTRSAVAQRDLAAVDAEDLLLRPS